jgi:general secretion pathway protein K
MKIRLRSQSDGIALLIVMCAIFVLSILAAGLAFSMRVESTLARNSDSNQQLVWMGRSGVELARWVLAQEATVQRYDALNQIWAGGTGSMGETNSALAGVPLSHFQIGDGWVSVKIIDLDRYANINSADDGIIKQALTIMGVDAGEMSIVSDSIQDWVQSGDMPRIAGAKNEYYQELNPPYNCKEAPMDDLSELLLVKGIWDHPEIYWGGAATNHPGASFQHHLGFGSAGEAPNYPFGLVDLFTPFSSGKININTADENVLQLLPGVDADTANKIIDWRNGPDKMPGNEDDTPFQSTGQLSAIGVQDPRAASYCGVNSSVFKVTVTAQIGNLPAHDFHAILYRPSGGRGGRGSGVQVVSFYWTESQ